MAHPFGTVAGVSFRLTVAHSMPAVVDRLAGELARPLADPLVPELVAVPGDGIRSWLTAELSRRLGAGAAGDGVVANVRFVFPSELVTRSIGRATPSGAWSVGALTWAIHDVLHTSGAGLGIPSDAVRCRAIADLFDRYALHRPRMVRAWEGGADLDADDTPLPPHLAWQPALWRRVVERLGGPSDVEATATATAALRAGRLVADVPERVFLVGLASLPGPHLHAIAALSANVDVHVLAPAASLAVWERLRLHCLAAPLTLPLSRAADPSSTAAYHPLNATWGRAGREAHLLLAGAAVDVDAHVEVVNDPGDPPGDPPDGTLLGRLQRDIRADRPPPGAPPAGERDGEPDDERDERLVLRPTDRSVEWHTCHGPGRQAEVLRDVVVRLLEERRADGTPRYEPRDIAVLCADVPTFAPLVEAAFASAPASGLPSIPLRVADRSLRQQNPLLDAVVALLDLLDGRFRASQVLAFAERPPVARRFGFGPEQLELITSWAAATHVHWGADAGAHRLVGLPEGIAAHTWRDGLDQLLVGATLADPAMVAAAGHASGPHGAEQRFGPGGTVPAADVEGDAVATAGALADLVGELHQVVDRLSAPATVRAWCGALADAVDALFDVADLDSWQRRDLDAELAALADESLIGDEPARTLVPAAELAALLADRLTARPGRVRFGTGAVTLSSLTAQRGVPHPVICLLGLDGDFGGAGVAASDDLTQASPCVGDREPRSELRAHLLDALLAAGDRVVLLSTGRDVRTNSRVPPAVPLAELADVIDATARVDHRAGRGGSATRSLTVEHPRQAWGEANFLSGELGVEGAWSFDAGARVAAEARRHQRSTPPFLAVPLPPTGRHTVSLAELAGTLANPTRTLLRDRLGAHLADDADPLSDLVPLSATSLGRWELADRLLAARLAAGDSWDAAAMRRWVELRRRSGAIPPLELGTRTVQQADALVDALLERYVEQCGAHVHTDPVTIDVDVTVGEWRVHGAVAGVADTLVTRVSPNRLRPGRTLDTWVRLAALTAMAPERPWRAVTVGRADVGGAVAVECLAVRDRSAAIEVLEVVLDLHERASCHPVPAFPRTTHALWHRGRDGAGKVWDSYTGFGEGADRWVVAALGSVDLAHLLAEAPLADEWWGVDGAPAAPPVGGSRIERWAERVWGTFERTAVATTDLADLPVGGSGEPGAGAP